MYSELKNCGIDVIAGCSQHRLHHHLPVRVQRYRVALAHSVYAWSMKSPANMLNSNTHLMLLHGTGHAAPGKQVCTWTNTFYTHDVCAEHCRQCKLAVANKVAEISTSDAFRNSAPYHRPPVISVNKRQQGSSDRPIVAHAPERASACCDAAAAH